MTVKKRDLVILVYLAGIVVAALMYFLYFSPRLAANETQAAENASLQAQYTTLSGLKAKQAEYQAKIKTDNDEITKMQEEFPGDIKAEDEILYARQLETTFGVTIPTVGVSDPVMVYSLADGSGEQDTAAAAANTDSTTADTTEKDAAAAATDSATTVTGSADKAASAAASSLENAVTTAGSQDTGILYSTPLAMTFTSTYDGLKNILEAIPVNQNKQSIESVSAAFDTTTGNISGTITLNKFYLIGANRTYIEPNITGVPTGTDNIFGTVTPAETDNTAETSSTTSASSSSSKSSTSSTASKSSS